MKEFSKEPWKPKVWIAVVLGLLFQSLAMLYLHRILWAIIYFAVSVAIGITEFYLLMYKDIHGFTYLSFNYIVMIIAAVHAYFIAKNYQEINKRAWYSKWYSLIGIFLVINLSVLPGRIFFYESFHLPAGSMAPSYPTGSYVWILKWGYGNYKLFGIQIWRSELSNPINRGDVIVFEYPENRQISYLKRVVGIPGDFIQYIDKKLIINDMPAEYSDIKNKDNHTIFTETVDETSYEILLSRQYSGKDFEIKVPAGQYFVLGDNRDNSRDSRFWGFLPEEFVIGRVVHVRKPETRY